MNKKTDIKVCRYVDCPHGKEIDITKDDYRIVGKTMYYHPDCLKKKKKGEWKDEKTKADLQYIKNGWVTHISKTVIYSQLFQCLNELIARGISSDYLVFVFDYIVSHKLNLRHPKGFKYFVDKDEIKVAYKKQQSQKTSSIKPIDFSGTADSSDAPKFTVNRKPNGFGCILNQKESMDEKKV